MKELERLEKVNNESSKSPDKRKVTFSLFKKEDGERCGEELTINKSFCWNGYNWTVPAVYVCEKGFVLEIFAEIDKKIAEDFISKWEFVEKGDDVSAETLRQIEKDNPFALDYNVELLLNGKTLRQKEGKGWSYIGKKEEAESEILSILEYYGLSLDGYYVYKEAYFPYSLNNKPTIKDLKMTLKKYPEELFGDEFFVEKSSDRIEIVSPVTRNKHVLTVIDKNSEELQIDSFDGKVFPKYITTLTYAIVPDISDKIFRIADCKQSDQPICDTNKNESSSIGIIGGADGPTAVILSNKNDGMCHTAVSALTHTPQEKVCWRPIFKVKTVEDFEISLI